jgi:copper(I)-binding protein
MRNLLRTAAAVALAFLFIQAAPFSGIRTTASTLRLIPCVPAAGYVTIENRTRESLVLTGAHSADCASVMMHKSSTVGGMARMEDVTSVEILAFQTFVFAPGGYHLMCMQPSPRLRVGGRMEIVFELRQGGPLRIPFVVVNARGRTR